MIACLLQEVDSKGFISTASITNVNSVGDVKFEVVTNNRTFIFKADSEGENRTLGAPLKLLGASSQSLSWFPLGSIQSLSFFLAARKNRWVMALHDCVAGRHQQGTMSALPTADYQGYLDLRGFKGKIYVAVALDKVFLYKTQEVRAPHPAESEPSLPPADAAAFMYVLLMCSLICTCIYCLPVAQDQRIGVGITYINMNVGNVRETDQRGFDLTTPYRLRPFR